MKRIVLLFSILIISAHSFAQTDKGVSVKSKTVEGRRIALVIGNAKYQRGGRLFNTVNDSADMRIALQELGFTVIGGDDLTSDQMKKVIKDFGRELSQGGIGLFYFSGHGIQANGRNYLIPVDAPEMLREETLEFDAVDVNRVLSEMAAARNGFNIVILDACRNNPFGKGWRDSSGGLAQIKAPTGTLIGYATAPDTVASDGQRRNGTYTEKLLQKMRIPNITIEQVFKGISQDVYDETSGKQDPWYASSLKGDFYFSRSENSVKIESSYSPKSNTESTFQTNPNNNNLDAENFLNNGEKYFEKKDYELAIEEYSKAIGANPMYALAYLYRGDAYFQKQNYDRAIIDYTKAIEINPLFTEAYCYRSHAYLIKKNYEQTIADSSRAIELNPTYKTPYPIRAEAYEKIGRKDLANADRKKYKELGGK